MTEQNKRVAYLMDEIGRINDVYLAEALVAKPRKRLNWIPYVSVAACLVLVLSMILPLGLFIGILAIGSNSGSTPGQESPMPTVPLDVYLAENAHTFQNVTVLGGEGIPGKELLQFADGNAYLVWHEEGSEAIVRSRRLTQREVNSLKKEMLRNTSVNSDSPDGLRCRVWLVQGDGTVLSPYLENTPGNVGYGVLFDYDPECVPSSGFTTLVSDILEDD